MVCSDFLVTQIGSPVTRILSDSDAENTGNEIQGALHMNLNNPLKWGPLKFNGLIKSLPDVYNDLGSADVLVFYCVIGSARSPAMCHLYREAVKTVADRPRNYNTKQKVMVIDGGITEFAKQQAGLKPVISKFASPL